MATRKDGTTDEQWAQYEKEKESHAAHVESMRGKVSDEELRMIQFCDAPNKPGYYRANND